MTSSQTGYVPFHVTSELIGVRPNVCLQPNAPKHPMKIWVHFYCTFFAYLHMKRQMYLEDIENYIGS